MIKNGEYVEPLRFDTKDEATAYARKRGWTVVETVITTTGTRVNCLDVLKTPRTLRVGKEGDDGGAAAG